ncbi:phage portal protein [Sporolactobacillus terrae]|uniref:Phage portal protein n=1 Tax=Sporolactobacillus terrae TaxID=269673 RepID=A0A5K7WT59_9BACL|nr:phage portal protein [Sporolactobacillus terrae]BBN97492.1 hypothetical protein St703_01970 [Sporolactobacillus terrae]
MLTNLDFLQIGKPWPPPEEGERIRQYEVNRGLFEGDHGRYYAEQFKRIQRVIGNFDKVVSYEVAVNYQKLISLKIADLLLGDPPKINAGDSGSPEQETVNQIAETTDLHNTAYETAIDVSRYGDGLFYVYKDESGKGIIDVTQPQIWFPIVSPDNVKRIQYHVLAWTYDIGRKTFLRAQIHSKGRYTEREYLIDAGIIKEQTVNDQVIQTGLDDFAIVQVPNVLTSDRVHGMDDYQDIDSIVSEIEVRIGQIARILDKHAAPSVQGPAAALERDPVTGEWKLKMGNYFARDSKDDAPVEYVTWDGQLEANFKMIEQLVNFLHAISEMGSSLLGDKEGGDGTAPSGTSLRFRLISPLAKVRRIAMRFRPALIKAIKLCSELGGSGIVNLQDVPVSVTFRNGLPDDPKETAEIMATRTGNKPTMSVKRALKTYDDMDDETAESEIEEIADEDAQSNPVSAGNFPMAGANTEPEDGEEE